MLLQISPTKKYVTFVTNACFTCLHFAALLAAKVDYTSSLETYLGFGAWGSVLGILMLNTLGQDPK